MAVKIELEPGTGHLLSFGKAKLRVLDEQRESLGLPVLSKKYLIDGNTLIIESSAVAMEHVSGGPG